MWKYLMGSLTVISSAVPALAQDLFVRPESCKRIATAQYDSCRVDNHFDCETEVGQLIRVEEVSEHDLVSVDVYNKDSRNREAAFNGTSGNFRVAESGGSEFVAVQEGSSRIEFGGDFQFFGMWRPVSGSIVLHYSGRTKALAGRVFHILEAETTLQFPYPATPVIGTDTILFDQETDLAVMLEIGLSSNFGDDEPPTLLIELSLPGQPGFGSETPKFGCASLSSWQQSSLETPA